MLTYKQLTEMGPNVRSWIRHLIRLGVSTQLATHIGLSSKGYYRLAKTKAVQISLNND